MGLVAGWSSKLDLPVKMPLTSSAKWLLPYSRLIFASELPYTQVLPSYTFFKKNPSKGKRGAALMLPNEVDFYIS